MDRYHEPRWVDRADALARLAGSAHERLEAILAISLNEPDGAFAEALLLGIALSTSRTAELENALLGLGHNARRHRRLFFDETLSVVKQFADDPRVAGRASDALSDISIFARK